MSMPHKLFRKLQETLGEEGAQAMADWMGEVGSRTDGLRADIAELRHEMDVKFTDLHEEMRGGFAKVDAKSADLREEMHAGLAKVDVKSADLREEIRVGFARIDAKFAEVQGTMAQRHADLLKWMLGFWVISLATVVAAIIGFARTLR